jgi:hypothetical protein
LFFQHPIQLAQALSGYEPRLVLGQLWQHAGESLDVSQRLPADGLDHDIRTIGDTLIVTVLLPIPQRMPEAHFVAAIVRRPVLCAWTRDGAHVNIGRQVPATLEDFISAVVAEIDASAQS